MAILIVFVATLVLHRGGGGVNVGDASPPMVRMAERFDVLAGKDSNRCSLAMPDVLAMSPAGRLQGSCCRSMEFERYAEQERGLRAYRSLDLMPTDPYDVSVSLAQRLLDLDRSIRLSTQQSRTYDRVVALSQEKGPCCCRCWHWDAFEGQAKALIARNGVGAREIARIWDLEDGCGGPA